MKQFLATKIHLPKLDMSKLELFSPLRRIFAWFSSTLEYIGMVVAVGLTIIASVILAPFLQILVLLINWVKYPVRIFLNKLSSILNRLKTILYRYEEKLENKIERKLKKTTRYWDDRGYLKLV